MKKCKSGWEKEKLRKDAEKKLKKIVADLKKVTDFFYVRELKIDNSGSKYNTATLCSSTSSDCIAEPNLEIVSSKPN